MSKKLSLLLCIAMITCCIGCNKSKPAPDSPEQVDSNNTINPDIEPSGVESADADADHKEKINPDDESSGVESSDADVADENRCSCGTSDCPSEWAEDFCESDVEACQKDEGCACGNILCPSGWRCIRDRCVYTSSSGDGADAHHTVYCADGCACGGYISNQCPENSICDEWIADGNWSDISGVDCVKLKPFKDNKALLKSLSDYFDYQSKTETKDYVFSEIHYKDKNKDFKLLKKDGKDVNYFVKCSQPGCDCNGVPLEEGFLCVEQHVVLSKTESEDYDICPWPYISYTYDRVDAGGSCDIADNVIEQICFNSKSCKCGDKTITTGDVCINGQGHCSSKHPRTGCLCGNDKMKADDGYGCYKDNRICQAGMATSDDGNKSQTCSCLGKEIHIGDICTKDAVICGTNSSTPGCICGDKPLVEGYRCFENKQICNCHENGNANIDKKDFSCTCKCVDNSISPNQICGTDGNIVKESSGFDKSACGNTVRVPANGIYMKYQGRKFKYSPLYASPEFDWLACTCGTGKAAPAEGYNCGYEEDSIGNGSEWQAAIFYAGWQCQNYEGCTCGNTKCKPGDLCDGDQCIKFITFEGDESDIIKNCKNNDLADLCDL